jgi:IS5 family transposase
LKQHPRKNKTAINIEYMKASIRARVEHPFRIIKRQFGFVKARYKGLLKNDNQLAMLFTGQPVSGGPNDTSVGEISVKTGNNARNGEETV